MKKVIEILTIIISGILILLSISSCGSQAVQKQTQFVMDTYCTIQAYGDETIANNAIEKAFNRIKEIDEKFNVLNESSPFYKFNNDTISIEDDEIIDVAKVATEISIASGGAFDITVYPLIKLWGFYDDSLHIPEAEELEKCLADIGYHHLELGDGALKKISNSVGVDLGGIAKGYAIGEAARVLKEEGIETALIDAGGDIYAIGQPKKRLWRVGVQNPRGEGLVEILEVKNMAVVTSGDYERYFEKDGVRYHHILNPKTGYPARELISVTIIAQDPMQADAWSTALFVMGIQDGLRLVEKMPGLEALMITSDEKVLYSSGLEKSIVKE